MKELPINFEINDIYYKITEKGIFTNKEIISNTPMYIKKELIVEDEKYFIIELFGKNEGKETEIKQKNLKKNLMSNRYFGCNFNKIKKFLLNYQLKFENSYPKIDISLEYKKLNSLQNLINKNYKKGNELEMEGVHHDENFLGQCYKVLELKNDLESGKAEKESLNLVKENENLKYFYREQDNKVDVIIKHVLCEEKGTKSTLQGLKDDYYDIQTKYLTINCKAYLQLNEIQDEILKLLNQEIKTYEEKIDLLISVFELKIKREEINLLNTLKKGKTKIRFPKKINLEEFTKETKDKILLLSK